MPWPLTRERLLKMLAQTDGHIASIEESIERQKRTIAQFDAAGGGDAETAKTLRALLVSMEKAQRLYSNDRERIRRLIAEQPE
jgi:hypothetical protein